MEKIIPQNVIDRALELEEAGTDSMSNTSLIAFVTYT